MDGTPGGVDVLRSRLFVRPDFVSGTRTLGLGFVSGCSLACHDLPILAVGKDWLECFLGVLSLCTVGVFTQLSPQLSLPRQCTALLLVS